MAERGVSQLVSVALQAAEAMVAWEKATFQAYVLQPPCRASITR